MKGKITQRRGTKPLARGKVNGIWFFICSMLLLSEWLYYTLVSLAQTSHNGTPAPISPVEPIAPATAAPLGDNIQELHQDQPLAQQQPESNPKEASQLLLKEKFRPPHVLPDFARNRQRQQSNPIMEAPVDEKVEKKVDLNPPATAAVAAANQTSWIDQIVASQYGGGMNGSKLPVVYPARWPKGGNYPTDVMYAEWTKGAMRRTGIGPDAVDAANGGVTVQGNWPDQISKLSFITIPKNAHTALMNIMGDLRQRLGANAKVIQRGRKVDIQSTLKDAKMQQQTQGGNHAVFAVLRDPVDRFISGTCQELLLKKSGFGGRASGWCYNEDPMKVLSCTLDMISRGSFLHHQKPQVPVIGATVQDIDVAVTILPFETATGGLIRELGGAVQKKKVRDRKDPSYTSSTGGTAGFCKLTADDLDRETIQKICQAYKVDVDLLQSIGLPSSHCAAANQAVQQQPSSPPVANNEE